nr:hypothetical protein CFP56_35815 [Quercus suber]
MCLSNLIVDCVESVDGCLYRVLCDDGLPRSELGLFIEDVKSSIEYNISKMGDLKTIKSMEYKWGTMQWSSHRLYQLR